MRKAKKKKENIRILRYLVIMFFVVIIPSTFFIGYIYTNIPSDTELAGQAFPMDVFTWLVTQMIFLLIVGLLIGKYLKYKDD